MGPINLIRPFLIAGAILLIPLIGMQVSREVQWDLADFLSMGAILIAAGFVYELIAARTKDIGNRIVVAVLVTITVLLIWVELAVGIFD